ncbi:hypothetical protein vBValMR10Z_288 [Vibrio phage vB_ValM_R10Z]|nr:hypothetical protein vBValMR10Z_288 [Vibrio phage vB_ValM_R10Z]
MGSFNTTCAISRTPILEGQKARVFFLVMDTFDQHYNLRSKSLYSNVLMGSKCYPWDTFKVIGYPLLAKYADYNNYEFEDADMESLTLKAINNIYMPNRVPEGKSLDDYNEYHDYMEIDEIEDMNQLQDMEHSGALRVKTCHGVSLIAKMAIHEEIYQQMILDGTYTTGWGEDAKTYTFTEEVDEFVAKYSKSTSDLEMISARGRLQIERARIELEKDDTKTEEEKKEIIDSLIELQVDMVKFDTQFERSEWLTETHPIVDMKENDFGQKIAEAYIGGKWTSRFFLANNLEFMPAMTSGQCHDMCADAERLRKMADIIEDLQPDWYFEESVQLKVERTTRLTLRREDLHEKFSDWYDEDDQEYQDYLAAVEYMNEQSSFTVGDKNCKMAQFIEEYDVLRDVDDGQVINFN